MPSFINSVGDSLVKFENMKCQIDEIGQAEPLISILEAHGVEFVNSNLTMSLIQD